MNAGADSGAEDDSHWVQAIYKYSSGGRKFPTGETDIPFEKEGDKMIAIAEIRNGWLRVDFNGTIGIVPVAYVKKIVLFEAIADKQSQGITTSTGDKDLGFKVGQRMIFIQTMTQDWMKARIEATNEEGLVPVIYVKEVKPETKFDKQEAERKRLAELEKVKQQMEAKRLDAERKKRELEEAIRMEEEEHKKILEEQRMLELRRKELQERKKTIRFTMEKEQNEVVEKDKDEDEAERNWRQLELKKATSFRNVKDLLQKKTEVEEQTQEVLDNLKKTKKQLQVKPMSPVRTSGEVKKQKEDKKKQKKEQERKLKQDKKEQKEKVKQEKRATKREAKNKVSKKKSASNSSTKESPQMTRRNTTKDEPPASYSRATTSLPPSAVPILQLPPQLLRSASTPVQPPPPLNVPVYKPPRDIPRSVSEPPPFQPSQITPSRPAPTAAASLPASFPTVIPSKSLPPPQEEAPLAPILADDEDGPRTPPTTPPPSPPRLRPTPRREPSSPPRSPPAQRRSPPPQEQQPASPPGSPPTQRRPQPEAKDRSPTQPRALPNRPTPNRPPARPARRNSPEDAKAKEIADRRARLTAKKQQLVEKKKANEELEKQVSEMAAMAPVETDEVPPAYEPRTRPKTAAPHQLPQIVLEEDEAEKREQDLRKKREELKSKKEMLATRQHMNQALQYRSLRMRSHSDDEDSDEDEKEQELEARKANLRAKKLQLEQRKRQMNLSHEAEDALPKNRSSRSLTTWQ